MESLSIFPVFKAREHTIRTWKVTVAGQPTQSELFRALLPCLASPGDGVESVWGSRSRLGTRSVASELFYECC